jgi:ADP-ribosylglycohydrolase
MSTTIPTLIDKCKGAMLATAIGDALGWPNEQRSKNTSNISNVNDCFVEWTRRCGRLYWHNERILPGEYSDDTQMTLSVARSIIAGNWEEALIKELPFWLKYERGGGRALLKAEKTRKKGLLLWKSNYTHDYFNAGGNGAVMRILPHVIATVNTPDITTLMENVIKDSIITHGHSRAILGATCYAYALNYLMRKDSVLEYGELVSAVLDTQNIWGAFPDSDKFANWIKAASRNSDYTNEWKLVLANMVKQLEFIKVSLKKGLMLEDISILTQLECFTKVNGAGDVAILAAIYLVSRYANNPSLGIKVPAFSFGADTDTIASITGGLLGMLCGTNWIHTEWKMVQDYDYIIRLTELLLSDNSKDVTKIESMMKEQANDWKNSQIGLIHQISAETIQSGRNDTIIITKWQSVLGQTIYIKEHKQKEHKLHQSEKQMQLPLQLPTDDTKQQTIVQKQVIAQKLQRQFILRTGEVVALLDNPLLRRITLRKVLLIVNSLLVNNETSASIAKQHSVEQTVVDFIKTYIRVMRES